MYIYLRWTYIYFGYGNMADIALRLNECGIKEPIVTSPFENIIIRNAQGIRIDYAEIKRKGPLHAFLLSMA